MYAKMAQITLTAMPDYEYKHEGASGVMESHIYELPKGNELFYLKHMTYPIGDRWEVLNTLPPSDGFFHGNQGNRNRYGGAGGKVHVGPNGGRFTIKKGKKVYVK